VAARGQAFSSKLFSRFLKLMEQESVMQLVMTDYVITSIMG
jgi:hypothetical protein